GEFEDSQRIPRRRVDVGIAERRRAGLQADAGAVERVENRHGIVDAGVDVEDETTDISGQRTISASQTSDDRCQRTGEPPLRFYHLISAAGIRVPHPTPEIWHPTLYHLVSGCGSLSAPSAVAAMSAVGSPARRRRRRWLTMSAASVTT